MSALCQKRTHAPQQSMPRSGEVLTYFRQQLPRAEGLRGNSARAFAVILRATGLQTLYMGKYIGTPPPCSPEDGIGVQPHKPPARTPDLADHDVARTHLQHARRAQEFL